MVAKGVGFGVMSFIYLHVFWFDIPLMSQEILKRCKLQGEQKYGLNDNNMTWALAYPKTIGVQLIFFHKIIALRTKKHFKADVGIEIRQNALTRLESITRVVGKPRRVQNV